MSQENIYVIGHRSPDLDSVAGAIAYAFLRNKLEKTDLYIPAITGKINKETEYVLNKFNFEVPEVLESAKDKKVVLVDHNEFSQSVTGIEEATVEEVLDHHKVDFSYSSPILFRVFPWGASCSIIAQEFEVNSVDISKEMAGIMLSAILIDTVITKSPTCTDKDISIIEKLSALAGISDWQDFGIELFRVRSSVNKLGAEEIVKGDFKVFVLKQGKVGIGQVETADLGEFENREDELLETLDRIKSKENYHTVILFITDIIKEGSLFLIKTDDKEKLDQAFGVDFATGKAFVEGIMSRKKQVAPKIEEVFN